MFDHSNGKNQGVLAISQKKIPLILARRQLTHTVCGSCMFYGSAKQTAAGLFCYCKMWGDHSKSSLFTCTQEGKAKKCCRSIHIYIICLRLFPHFILLPFYYHAWYLKVLLCSMYVVRVAIWFTEGNLKIFCFKTIIIKNWGKFQSAKLGYQENQLS